MNRTQVVHGAGAFTLPAALVVGGSLLTLGVVGASSSRSAAAPRPVPTVTVTTTRTETTAPVATRPTRRPVPSPSASGPRSSGVLAASAQDAPAEAAGGSAGGAPSVQPSSAPQRPSAVRRPRGVVLSARALDVSARVHLGGR